MTTRDEILAMAKEAGLWAPPDGSWRELNYFFHLAYAAGQRDMQERAANVCESWNCGFSLTANECAEEIRNLEVK